MCVLWCACVCACFVSGVHVHFSICKALQPRLLLYISSPSYFRDILCNFVVVVVIFLEFFDGNKRNKMKRNEMNEIK